MENLHVINLQRPLSGADDTHDICITKLKVCAWIRYGRVSGRRLFFFGATHRIFRASVTQKGMKIHRSLDSFLKAKANGTKNIVFSRVSSTPIVSQHFNDESIYLLKVYW